ncbi:thiamine-phosphate kinase [Nocardia sp. NPDC127526]|uniref:thiamine-phosphate kinase n=1 Tax=Nocardia sp. NPDC127526 TaxID=3345393 RepID=UPI00362D4D32
MRDLGEFALIDRINAGRTQAPGVLMGPGDDAALVAAPAGRFVVTTDMLLEHRHFRLDWSSPQDIGRKAIAQNAADVVSMGARPSAFVVALGCPSDTPVAFVEALADGMWVEAERAGASIAGGDMVRSSEIIISVTAFGDPLGAEVITRSGARPGDVVAVAGRLGRSAAGLAVLSADADLDRFADVVAAHRVPQPRYEAVLSLPAAALPRGAAEPPVEAAPHHAAHPGDVAVITALTDVSDGLLADLGHIAQSSGVAIDLDGSALRDGRLESIAAEIGADALEWVLAGGEDHAFAATFSDSGDLPAGWVSIGRVGAGAGVTVDGVTRSGPTGWESFA